MVSGADASNLAMRWGKGTYLISSVNSSKSRAAPLELAAPLLLIVFTSSTAALETTLLLEPCKMGR
jgi:hypothetical protein